MQQAAVAMFFLREIYMRVLPPIPRGRETAKLPASESECGRLRINAVLLGERQVSSRALHGTARANTLNSEHATRRAVQYKYSEGQISCLL